MVTEVTSWGIVSLRGFEADMKGSEEEKELSLTNDKVSRPARAIDINTPLH